MNRFKNRFTLLLLFLLAFAPIRGFAYGEVAKWDDKTLGRPLQALLLAPSSWKRVAAGLDSFEPKPEQPLTLRSACAANVDSAFYRELEDRGATVLQNRRCSKLLLWASEGDTGLTFTFEDLQKKFLPITSAAEAASFLFATGYGATSGLYGAAIDGKFYIMGDDSYCHGLAHIRSIFAFDANGKARRIGTVTDPAPRGSPCPLHSN